MSIINQLKNLFRGKQTKPILDGPRIPPQKPKYSRTVIQNALKKRATFEILVAEGLTFAEIKTRCNINGHVLSRYLDVLGLKPSTIKKVHKDPRNQEIVKAREEGLDYATIARMYSLTRERVRQIVAKEAPHLIHKRAKEAEFIDIEPKIRKQKRLPVTREVAVEVMKLRKQSMTWDQVAAKLDPGSTGLIFRSKLQRFLPLIFTPEEKEEFFPRHGDPKYKA
jgi:DNA-binding CsgD family transcriptional regulator